MDSNVLGKYDETFDQIIVRSLNLDRERNPRIANLKYCVLRNGKQVYKIAKYWTIINEHDGSIHHYSLRIESYEHTKKHGWRIKPDFSITLGSESPDEIQALFTFLEGIPQINDEAAYTIIRQNDTHINGILDVIKAADQRSELIEEILLWVGNEPSALQGLMDFAVKSPERSKALIAALNYGHYSQILSEFKDLIEKDHRESMYQRFLEKNPWIFGSEFSVLIQGRQLVANNQFDFPLRRTADDYLEIIEIKRPIRDSLFVGERLAPRSELNEAIAQAEIYLELLDRQSDRIWREYGIRAEKVRAKVVIGRDGDDHQLSALRRLSIYPKNAKSNRM